VSPIYQDRYRGRHLCLDQVICEENKARIWRGKIFMLPRYCEEKKKEKVTSVIVKEPNWPCFLCIHDKDFYFVLLWLVSCKSCGWYCVKRSLPFCFALVPCFALFEDSFFFLYNFLFSLNWNSFNIHQVHSDPKVFSLSSQSITLFFPCVLLLNINLNFIKLNHL